MKHISHYEDVLFEQGSTALSNILYNIQDISLKWDGIAVVAGSNEFGRFVSTKSYFNKTPKIYRSLEEINTIQSEGIREKLTVLFLNHPGNEKFQVNQGDMLWWPGSFTDLNYKRKFTSNIIEYNIPLHQINSKQDLGIVWHTDLNGNGLFDSTDRIWSKNIQIPLDIYSSQYQANPEFDKLVNPTFTFIMKKFMMFCVMNEITLDESSKDVFHCWGSEKFISLLRSYDEYENKYKEEFDNIWNNLENIVQEINLVQADKYRSLTIYDRFMAECGYLTFVNMNNGDRDYVSHEGYVIGSPFGTLKVVDRYQFSRINRSDSVKRGWQKGT